MGRRGPKPKPPAVLRMVSGNDRLADERDRSTPKPHPVAPRPPAGLSHYARECWRMHAPELERLGLLTVLDGASFRLACESYSIALAALDAMRPKKADGTPDRRKKYHEVIYADPRHQGSLRRHPALLVYGPAVADYRAWASRFGLTPSDRVGLRPGAPIGVEQEDDDDDADFFGF